MEYEWDEAKAFANEAKHGVSFGDVGDFNWDSAEICPDKRRNYGEPRYKALGLIGGRLHVLIFTWRGARCRVISLRKANDDEQEYYGQED